ncbi:MAG: DinB family protein [bacterium]
MIPLVPWFQRQWSFGLPAGAFPAVLERLRGTPGRAAELVANVSGRGLSARSSGKWSVKDHLGHLSDLHELDVRRVREFGARVAVLSAADPSNTRTEQAAHRAAPVDRIIATLHRQRLELIEMLQDLEAPEIVAAALHPRLGQPVRLIDWAAFVADHDDHHLAAARAALGAAGVLSPDA